MALPVYLQQFKAAGIYRVVYDQSAIEGVEAEKLRLVVGYSDKGPFNIPTYVKSISDFKALYGGISKTLERRGIFFHRMAMQALAAGPILCLNLKKFSGETVDAFKLKTLGQSALSVERINAKIEDLYDRSRFWELSEDKLIELNSGNYINIAATDTLETSISFVIRKALPEHVRGYNVSVSDWYSDSDVMPEFLEGHLDAKMSDFMAEIYVFGGQFSADQIAASSALQRFFNIDANAETEDKKLTIKPTVTNSWGTEVDALDALYNEPTSNAIGRYVGSLIPEFKDKQGNYVALNILFNKDNDAHHAMMSFNVEGLYDDMANAYETVCVAETNEGDSEYSDVTASFAGDMVGGPIEDENAIEGAEYKHYTFNGATYEPVEEEKQTEYGVSYYVANVEYTPVVYKEVNLEGYYKIDEAASGEDDTDVVFVPCDNTEDVNTTAIYKQDIDGGFDEIKLPSYAYGEKLYKYDDEKDVYTAVEPNALKDGDKYYEAVISYSKVAVKYPKVVTGLYAGDEKELVTDAILAKAGVEYYVKGSSVKPNYMRGYTFNNNKPAGTTWTDKLAWHLDILSTLQEYAGLRAGLLSRANIDYRYIVDTFEAFPEVQDNSGDSSTTKDIFAGLAKEKENAFAILNFPAARRFMKAGYVDKFGGLSVEAIVDGNKKGVAPYGLPIELNGASFCAFYTPLKFSDGYVDSIIPSAALVSNLFMRKYSSRQPYYVVAGANYGVISAAGLVGPDYNYSKEELNIIEPFGVNCMIYRPGFGTFINANQTAKQTPKSALSSVNVRELVIYLQDEIEQVLQAYQWEFNNETTRNAILDKANYICSRVAANGGIQAYRNVMDTSNNTSEVIDNEMAIISTHIEPGRNCGKMVQELTIYRSGQLSANIIEY